MYDNATSVANRHRRLWPRTNGFGLFLIYTHNRYDYRYYNQNSCDDSPCYYSVMVSHERTRRIKT